MIWIVCGISFLVVTGIMVVALCRSAALADKKHLELFEKMMREKHEQTTDDETK